jgi:hypothetical protein
VVMSGLKLKPAIFSSSSFVHQQQAMLFACATSHTHAHTQHRRTTTTTHHHKTRRAAT